MSVNRLTIGSLRKLISGQINENATCIVKFYSNGCHFCHNLREYYEDISNEEEYSDMHFFAFNVLDYPQIEKVLDFNGVPTISVIRTKKGKTKPRIRTMPDPLNPHKKTWYTVNEITTFISREK